MQKFAISILLLSIVGCASHPKSNISEHIEQKQDSNSQIHLSNHIEDQSLIPPKLTLTAKKLSINKEHYDQHIVGIVRIPKTLKIESINKINKNENNHIEGTCNLTNLSTLNSNPSKHSKINPQDQSFYIFKKHK